jgi:hypothetical protein
MNETIETLSGPSGVDENIEYVTESQLRKLGMVRINGIIYQED